MFIAEIALLPDSPKGIVYALRTEFGNDWKKKYYTELSKKTYQNLDY